MRSVTIMRNVVFAPMSYLLAATYLSLAMFGHAWHDHGSCHEGACARQVSDSESAPACDCEWHSDTVLSTGDLAEKAPKDSQATPSPEEGIAAAPCNGSPHDCLACLALSHLSVGYAELHPLTIELATTESSAISLEAVVLAARPVVYGPRGPPLQGC